MSDEALMLEARKFERNLLNFFCRQGASYSEGEDLVQETYLRLWNYRREYEPSAKLSTFLFTIARQVHIDAIRHQTRRVAREEAWERDRMCSPTPDMMAHDDVRWAVSRLPVAMQEVAELGVMQCRPYSEVAEILGIPVGTVKSRMFNLLKRLKEIVYDETKRVNYGIIQKI